MVAKRVLRKSVELTGLDICLELPVPGCPMELQKPGTELSKLPRRERLDLPCDVLDVAHVGDPTDRV